MPASDIVNIVGLGLGTVGAVLLAYDVVYGPGKQFQASNFKTQLEVLKSTRKLARDTIKNLPLNWNAAEKQRDF